MEELLIRVPIWGALLAWGLGEWLRVHAPQPRSPVRGRSAWTAGALLAALHVAAGLHVRHRWSHDAAVADTARQTEAALGFAFGAGVWFNYAFLAVWIADAVWWWAAPAGFQGRPAPLDGAVRAYLAFIFVNGVIVFPHGPVRVVGIAVAFAVATAWYRGWGARGVPE
jgi:hypothetical protein